MYQVLAGTNAIIADSLVVAPPSPACFLQKEWRLKLVVRSRVLLVSSPHSEVLDDHFRSVRR